MVDARIPARVGKKGADLSRMGRARGRWPTQPTLTGARLRGIS